MVEIQQRGIEFLRSVQKVGTSYRALGLAERSSTVTLHIFYDDKKVIQGRCPNKAEKLITRRTSVIRINRDSQSLRSNSISLDADTSST